MMVNRHRCPDCDGWIDMLGAATTPETCPFCAAESFEFEGKVGVVYGSGRDIRPEAQELVEEWREKARMASEPAKTDTFVARAETYGKCADSLEEVYTPDEFVEDAEQRGGD